MSDLSMWEYADLFLSEKRREIRIFVDVPQQLCIELYDEDGTLVASRYFHWSKPLRSRFRQVVKEAVEKMEL